MILLHFLYCKFVFIFICVTNISYPISVTGESSIISSGQVLYFHYSTFSVKCQYGLCGIAINQSKILRQQITAAPMLAVDECLSCALFL